MLGVQTGRTVRGDVEVGSGIEGAALRGGVGRTCVNTPVCWADPPAFRGSGQWHLAAAKTSRRQVAHVLECAHATRGVSGARPPLSGGWASAKANRGPNEKQLLGTESERVSEGGSRGERGERGVAGARPGQTHWPGCLCCRSMKLWGVTVPPWSLNHPLTPFTLLTPPCRFVLVEKEGADKQWGPVGTWG